MIGSDDLYRALLDRKIDFFTGVPDSLLKNFCAYIQDTVAGDRNIIAANEGGAIALAAGHYLASGKPALVYLQNSGIGNAINPLVSLCDAAVYSIPVLLLIGWRGEPGVKDAPQHVRQGEITPGLLDTLGIPYSIVSGDTDIGEVLDRAVSEMESREMPYALVVKKGSFEPYTLKTDTACEAVMERESAIKIAASAIGPDAVIVSTTGKISRELYEYRVGEGLSIDRDFLTVGSMGHCSQIAAGIAITRSDREVYCFDGDGAVIMHMGSLCINASLGMKNFKHIIFNNACHDSVGGQPTTGDVVDFTGVALACGYRMAERAETEDELKQALGRLIVAEGPALLEVRVKKGARGDLGRPKATPVEMKKKFMAGL
jgi:phosphonopyruvate decarboxylase